MDSHDGHVWPTQSTWGQPYLEYGPPVPKEEPSPQPDSDWTPFDWGFLFRILLGPESERRVNVARNGKPIGTGEGTIPH